MLDLQMTKMLQDNYQGTAKYLYTVGLHTVKSLKNHSTISFVELLKNNQNTGFIHKA